MMDDKQAQEISDWTSDLLALSDVKRWSVVHTLRTQSVAEHSFRVAIIAASICCRLGRAEDLMPAVVWWSLIHDAPEGMTGDIDGKFKRGNPAVKSAIVAAEEEAFPWCKPPNDKIKWIVKVADYIESATFIQANATGPRANDIYHELYAILMQTAVSKMCEVLGLPVVDTERIIRNIVHESVSESNCRQLRRHRRP